MLDDLTPLEERIVDAARRGDWAEPETGLPAEEIEAADDPALRVRAELIRELLMGRRGDMDPRGVRVQRIRVVGQLDLDGVTAVTSLFLGECVLPDGVTCVRAQLHEVNLQGSRLSGLHAVMLRTDGNLSLHGATVTGTGKQAAVLLSGAHIGGQLMFDDAEITNDDGPALVADSLHTDHSMTMQNAVLRGAHEDGAVWLHSARIDGQLDCDRAEITNDIGPALHADRLRTDGNMSLIGANLTTTSRQGAVRLINAHIGGQLNSDHAEITNNDGPALEADSLRTDNSVALRNTILRGGHEKGAVRLINADIGGQLSGDHAEITNDTGPALHADRLRTRDNMFLRNATVTGGGKSGAVRLIGAHVGYQLSLDHTVITNNTGLALDATGLRAEGDLLLRDATLHGAGHGGTVRLINVHVGGWLNLDEVRVENESQALILRHDGVRMSYGTGPLMDLTGTQVTGLLSLHAASVCRHARADIGQTGCPDGKRRIAAQELVFARLAGMSWRQWLHLLIHHTPTYGPQPYQQLAKVERASGHDNNARQVLIAQQEDLRRRTPEALGGSLARWRHWLWGWLGRYGYRAHRLVIALTIVLALAGGLGYVAGQVPTRPGHHVAERVSHPGTRCSTAELIGLGIDRGLPLGVTGLRARCDLDTATKRGQAFTFVIWVLQALVWALATLAVAAYTGLVRKPA